MNITHENNHPQGACEPQNPLFCEREQVRKSFAAVQKQQEPVAQEVRAYPEPFCDR